MPTEFEPKAAEQGKELQEAANERLKELAEKSGEKLEDRESGKSREHEARKETEAIFNKEQSAGEKKSGGEPNAPSATIRREDRESNYKQTMRHVQDELSPPARMFSKVIHHPVVEKTSDAIGSTVARPNAILAGSITALLVVGCVYFIARTVGYELQGSETIISFACGWLLGILFDFFKVMVTGKR